MLDAIKSKLEAIHSKRGNSETDSNRALSRAVEFISSEKGLSKPDKDLVIKTMRKAANPSGWYVESTGIMEGLKALENLSMEAAA